MPVSVLCPHCSIQIKTSSKHAGRVVSCPACGQPFQLPDLAPASPAVPAASPFDMTPDETEPLIRPRRRRRSSAAPWLLLGGVLLLFALCVLPAALLWFNPAQHDRQDRADPVEELPPNPTPEKALSEYEKLADEMASLHAKERRLKIIHQENERSRRASMELASNAGDFERVRQLTDQAIKEADELVQLSGEVAGLSGKWEAQNRTLDGLLKQELNRIEALPPDQGKRYLDRLERWQDRRQRAFEKGKSNSQ
jgi:hypothetical protein